MNSLLRAADINDFIQHSRKKNTKNIEKIEEFPENNNKENNYRVSPNSTNPIERANNFTGVERVSPKRVSTKKDSRIQYVMESSHKSNVENVRYLKTMIANDINNKMQNYKMNSPPDMVIKKYITEQVTKKSSFYYSFGKTESLIEMKVLAQILYEQIEDCCVNLAVLGHGHPKHNKLDMSQTFDQNKVFSDLPSQAYELEYMMKTMGETKKNEMAKINLEIEDLQLKCQNFENQLKRKNALINRLFSDRTLFVKSFDKLTGTLTRSYQFFMRYLSDTKDVYVNEILKIQLPNSFIANKQAQEGAEKLTKEICSLTKFLFWAKDYEQTDDLKFFNDVDYFKRIENEKKEYDKMFVKDFDHTNKNF